MSESLNAEEFQAEIIRHYETPMYGDDDDIRPAAGTGNLGWGAIIGTRRATP